MRFLSMIRVDENSGLVPSEQLMTDMGKLIEELKRENALISTAGLRPTAEGARVRLRRGKLSTTDGPFTETKEVIGGFAILEAASMKEAIELTKRFLRVHGDEWDVECEVRQMEGPTAAPRHELHSLGSSVASPRCVIRLRGAVDFAPSRSTS